MSENSPKKPHPNGTDVFIRIGEGLVIAKVIEGKTLEKDLEVPSTDEEIPLSIVPKGTPFNTIEIIRTELSIESGFTPGTKHSFASSMLFPASETAQKPNSEPTKGIK